MTKPNQTTWSLYLAEPKFKPNGYYQVFDTIAEVLSAVHERGMPVHIDFDYWRDNGLGSKTGPSGFDLARALTEIHVPRPQGFNIYSADIVARTELESILGLGQSQVAS